MGISVVIPVRHDERALAALLAELDPYRGPDFEVVVVEADDSSIAAGLACDADRWVQGQAGRSAQLQLGVDSAVHDCLWFLHADSSNVAAACEWLAQRSAEALSGSAGAFWGRFEVQFDDNSLMLKIVPWFMNARSRLTGIATGDQGIFVDRSLLNDVGGWPQQPLMEDVELCKQLRGRTPPSLPPRRRAALTTSARRWRTQGVWRTIMLMWWLRFRYATGVDPAKLHRLYYGQTLTSDD